MIYLKPRFPLSLPVLLRPFLVILLLFALLGFRPASAEAVGDAADAPSGQESLDRITRAALDHARSVSPAGAQLDAGVMDPRLRLARCTQPLGARAASGHGAGMSVEVSCAAAGWKLYVPVAVSVQVPVLVAVRGVARGARLSAADVQIQMRDRASLGPSWLDSITRIEGQVAARAIAAGSVMVPGALHAERLVRRGQTVALVGDGGSFTVRSQGKALSDAAAGEPLRVENPVSRRIVQGVVLADGSVRVGP